MGARTADVSSPEERLKSPRVMNTLSPALATPSFPPLDIELLSFSRASSIF
jgi:hypothetical protein